MRNYQFSIVHYQFVATLHRAHAKSTHLRICTFCISSAPNLDVQATAYDSDGIGILVSTAHAAQSSLASCPSIESPPCWLIVEPAHARQSGCKHHSALASFVVSSFSTTLFTATFTLRYPASFLSCVSPLWIVFIHQRMETGIMAGF